MTLFEEIHKQTMDGVYERNAAEWDQNRVRSLYEKGWLEKFLTSLPPSGNVLDVGCGAGEPIAQYFIERGFSVTGIDASQAMIDICQNRFPQHTWQVIDMRQLNLDQKFDGIIAWDSFFHLNQAEQRQTLQRFLQHLQPDGALLMTVGHESGEVLGSVAGEQVYHSSLDPEEYKSILRKGGFRNIEMVFQDKSAWLRTVLLAKRGDQNENKP